MVLPQTEAIPISTMQSLKSYNKDIANAFNNYFVNIGTRLANNLPSCNTAFESFINDKCPQSFFRLSNYARWKYPAVTPLELALLLNTPATDWLNLKIAEIFNHSLTSGDFPDRLKIDTITPIHKGVDKYDIGNFRPITVLFLQPSPSYLKS